MASLGDPQSDYERAYNSILTGDYDVAEKGFRQFLSIYPGDPRGPTPSIGSAKACSRAASTARRPTNS